MCKTFTLIFFLLVTSFLTTTIQAQAPGGVSSGLRVWLKADLGFAPSQWTDQSGIGNHYTQTNSTVQPQALVATPSYNYNPAVDFGNSSTGRFMTVPSGKPFSANLTDGTIYAVLYPKDINGYHDYLGFNGTTTNVFQVNANDPVVTIFGAGFPELYPYTPSTQSITANKTWVTDYTWKYNTNNSLVYGINGAVNTASSNIPADIYAANGSVLGSQPEFTNGNMTEVIAYQRALTAAEMTRVRSYLAIKYGLSLNASNVPDYVISTGTTVWTGAGNTGYQNNIFGLGRDNGSALYQKQSLSVQDSTITVYLGSLASSNAANGGVINNGDFLMMGDNKLTGYTAISYPAGTSFANATTSAKTTALSNRIWEVQTTGAAINWTVSIQANKYAAETYVLVSPDGSFTPATTSIYPVSASGVASGVVLGNGQYFRFANFVKSPGGVLTNISMWFNAGAAVNASIGGSAASDGGNAGQWLNLVNNASMYEVNNSGTNKGAGGAGTQTAPLYYSTTAAKLVNYNPSIYFSGSNGNGLYNYNAVSPLNSAGNATGFHFIVVARDENATPTTLRCPMGNGISGNNPSLDLQQDALAPNGFNPYTDCSGDWNGGGATMFNGGGIGAGTIANFPTGYATALANRQPQIFGAAVTGLTSSCGSVLDYWVDGFKQITSTALSGNTLKSMADYTTVVNSNGFFVGSSLDAPWTGTVNEVIGFSDKLSDASMQRVNTYLAIKYGITLGQGSNTAATTGNFHVAENFAQYNYIATDGTVIWPATTLNAYRLHIAGIGRDDAENLNQKQSASVNYHPIGQMTIGLQTITASNMANPASFTKDLSYLVWGDNGNTQSLATANTAFTFNGSSTNIRMNRVWALTTTNFNQTVLLRAPSSMIGSVPTSGCQKLMLLVSSDPSFASNDTVSILTLSGGNYVAYYQFPNNATRYFTFARVDNGPSGSVYLPIAGTTMASNNAGTCNINGWITYYADAAQTQKLFCINPNGNVLPPHNQLNGSVNVQFSNNQVTSGPNTTSMMLRTLTINDATAGTYNVNGGMQVRFYYSNSEMTASLTNPLTSSAWFKHSGSLATTQADQTATGLNNALVYISPQGGMEDTVPYVQYTGITSFSTFGFISSSSSILPVTLVSFNALLQANCQALITWKSATESGINDYVLEYSQDGSSFSPIGVYAGKGDNSSYQALHTPASGVAYYRLRMESPDGWQDYSRVVSVNSNCISAREIVIYPNPAGSQVTITNMGPGSKEIILYDSKGLVVKHMRTSNEQTNIDVSPLPPGMYPVKIIMGNTVRTSKIMKE